MCYFDKGGIWFYTKVSSKIQSDYVRYIGQYVSQIPICNCSVFRRNVLNFIREHYQFRKTYDNQHNLILDLIKRVNQARAIIMNPGAHQCDIPIDEQELRDALITLKEFQKKIKDKALYS